MQINRPNSFQILFLAMVLSAAAPSDCSSAAQDTAVQPIRNPTADSSLAQTAPVAAAYLQYLRGSLAALRKQLPYISTIADSSAIRILKSKALVRIRAQSNFASELGGRAAGLGMNTRPSTEEASDPDAVTILAYAPNISNESRVGNAANATGYRILFSAPEQLSSVSFHSQKKFYPSDFSAIIDNYTGSRPPFKFSGVKLASSSLLNIANGWVYTGELTSALTRLGKMPVFYLSFALDSRNDYRRAGKYSRELSPGLPYGPMKVFHDDVIISDTLEASEGQMVVPPIEAGVLGGKYLDQLDAYLTDYMGARSGQLEQILERATAVKRARHEVFFTSIGHTFPDEIPRKQRRTGVMHVISQKFEREGYKDDLPGPDDLLIVFGMPTYPKSKATFAAAHGINLILLSTEKPTDRLPETYNSDRFLWLEAPWPLEDGAVQIPGYDISVLPVTGFMNGALFWALATELYARTKE